MRKLTTKMASHEYRHHDIHSEEKMSEIRTLDKSKMHGDEGKGLFDCDSQFDSGYSSGLVRDDFDSGTCISLLEQNNDGSEEAKPSEKGSSETKDSVFDSGLGIDFSSDLDLPQKEELLLPTCTSMTADLSWRDVVQQDEDGDSLLHLTIVKGVIDVIFTFINLLPRPEFLNVCNSLYQTPLHLAVIMHQPKVVRRLVVARAAVDMRDHRGNTPLHLACQRGDLACAQALMVPAIAKEVEEAFVHYPVDLYRLPPKVLQLRNYEGETCVHAAIRTGHLKILEYLFGCGADANTRDGKSGNTALHMSVELRQVQLVQFLLWQCRACANIRNYAGLTPVQMALDACKHRPDQRLKAIVSLLKMSGATLPEALESDSESSDSSEEV